MYQPVVIKAYMSGKRKFGVQYLRCRDVLNLIRLRYPHRQLEIDPSKRVSGVIPSISQSTPLKPTGYGLSKQNNL